MKECPRPNGSLSDMMINVRITRTLKKTIMAYKLDEDKLMLPRSAAFDLLKKKSLKSIKNKMSEFTKCPNIKYIGKLKENQKTVLKYLYKKYYCKKQVKKGKGTTTLVMKAGRGKSFLTLGLIHILKIKTVIIVPNDKVLVGWKKVLEKYMPSCKIGIYSGKTKIDGDIVLMMIHSAVSTKIKESYISKFGLVVFDEIHKYCGPKHSEALWKFTRPYVLGLTATPNRPQKEDIIFKTQTGLTYAEKVPKYIKDDVKFKGTVKVIRYNGHPSYTKQLRNPITLTNSAPALITQIVEDPYRNQMIVEEIMAIYKNKNDVFAFSDRVEHLYTLETMLKANGAENVAVLVGGSTEDFTRHVFEKAVIILTTYPSSDTGVSIDRMTGIVFCTPRRNLMEQKLGRILRIGGDLTIERKAVDIIDEKVSLANQYGNRRKIYRAEGFSITEVETSWEDYQTYDNDESESKSDKKSKKDKKSIQESEVEDSDTGI
jgi:superfamily II DNA or RNA helicase